MDENKNPARFDGKQRLFAGNSVKHQICNLLQRVLENSQAKPVQRQIGQAGSKKLYGRLEGKGCADPPSPLFAGEWSSI